MEKLFIEGTDHSPLIEFNVDGKLKMEGKSLPEDVHKLYDPCVDFVQNLNSKNVVFDVNLEYFNTASSKKILELMRHIEANNKVDNVLINWYYEEGDDDSAEMAEVYEECLLRSKFRYHEYAEVE